MTNDKRCILAPHCANAGGPKCNALCGAWIGIHGHDGRGGRAAAAGLPADYARYTLANSPLSDVKVTTSQRDDGPPKTHVASAWLGHYAKTMSRQFETEGSGESVARRIKSLYLYSAEPGTGKTTTAAALVNEYITHHYIGAIRRGLQPDERPAYFLDVNAWQTAYNLATMTDNAAELAAVQAQMRIAAAVPFCVLDDVGVRSATESFRSMLHTIVNARMMAGLPTVYTSNVLLADLSTVFDRRLADRVRDMCVEVRFEGESKRGLRKTA